MDTNKKAKVAKMSTFAGSQKNHLLQLAKNRNLSLLEEESQYNASTTTRISMNSLHLDPIDDQRSSEFRSSFNSQEHSNRRFFKEDWETEDRVEPVKETFLSKIHTEIWNFAESQYFDNAMMAVIVLNAIVMTVDTFHWLDKLPETSYLRSFIKTIAGYDLSKLCDTEEFINAMEMVFLIIYTFEFFVKLIADWKGYLFHFGFNTFDITILAISYADIAYNIFLMPSSNTETCPSDRYEWIHDLNNASASSSDSAGSARVVLRIIRLFKALRALRAIRTIKFIRGLQVLTTALMDTVKRYLLNCVIIIVFFIMILSVLGNQFFGEENILTDPSKSTGISQSFRDRWTKVSSISSLFVFFTIDGWFDIYDSMRSDGGSASDYKNDTATTNIFVVFVVFALLTLHFILFNIFVGINIINIQEANDDYYEQITAEKEALLQHKKEQILRRQFEEVRKLKERQHFHNAHGGTGDFYDMLKQYQASLKHDDYVVGDNTVTNLDWIELELDTFDAMDDQIYRLQQLVFEYAHVLVAQAEGLIDKQLGK